VPFRKASLFDLMRQFERFKNLFRFLILQFPSSLFLARSVNLPSEQHHSDG
jgi:hypothetical protein